MDPAQDTVQQDITSQELDLGLEVAAPVIDFEAALAKTKPDFQRVVKLLGLQPIGGSQEEIEADLLSKQTAYESDLKTNLVPKITSAIQGLTSKASGGSTNITPKPGVNVNSSNQVKERQVKAWRGY